MTRRPGYHPSTHRGLTFHDARAAFLAGSDTPRDYLERCLAVIAEREPQVKAWVTLNEAGARAAADAATARYRDGKPLSPVDGMPVGIKDLIETRDMPTQMGSPMYAGYSSGRDSASVYALRSGGAVILGKTVTTELGFSHPGPTTNPFDPERTPGGSSSGSAAAVGAAMVPVALGSQVVGSVIRPAAFCANVAIKPTLGALNRGERVLLSQSHLGVHGSSLEDIWDVSWHVARVAGGDPGYPGLHGLPELAPPTRPARLALVETEGWSHVDADTRHAFERVLDGLRRAGVAIVTRAEHPAVEAFERAIGDSLALCRDVCGYELRWQLWNWRDKGPGLLSDSMMQRLSMADDMRPEDYRARLDEREEMRRRHAALAPVVDALVTLSCAGPAPLMVQSSRHLDSGISHTTGLPAFNAATSALGSPAITLPMLAVGAMPVGVQLIGQQHADWRLAGIARWLSSTVEPVAV
ncbi:MAG: amidase [Ectothiorhodospiraceae bacterium]|nr:amidase [Ectothiorhodospiraceae bacterium]